MNTSQQVIVLFLTSTLVILLGLGYQKYSDIKLSDDKIVLILYSVFSLSVLTMWFSLITYIDNRMKYNELEKRFKAFEAQMHGEYIDKINSCS